MIKEITKLDFKSLTDGELDLFGLESNFDAALAQGDYHINFAGFDLNLVFEGLRGGLIIDLEDIAIAIKEVVLRNSIIGPQSLILTFIGDDYAYRGKLLSYEFALEILT